MPTQSKTPMYDSLDAAFAKIHRYEHLAALAHWDQASMMPAGGNGARSEALAEIQVLIHSATCAPTVLSAVRAAASEPLSEFQQASLREIARATTMASALPESLVEAKSLAGSRCEHAWRSQRPRNDWAGFLENFKPVVAASRQEADILSQAFGVGRYDALMGKYEPGMLSSDIDSIFGAVKQWLPASIAAAMERQASENVSAPRGPFPAASQKELASKVMALLGFDFQRGRLDSSTHPFCGGVPEDVRITTAYRESDFSFSLMGVIHETGHARYEQGLPAGSLHLPVGRARSMGIHESQSLSFEMQLGSHPGFLRVLSPMLVEAFGPDVAFEPENLARLYTRVNPTLLRLEADELTYPAHIILRYEIERDLINGAIEPEDIPALWDEKMSKYLGLDSRGNHKDGAMQDIHWTDGSFGYFPSYTLGAMSAAQFFNAARIAQPDLDARIAQGDCSQLFSWLGENVWSQASQWETPDLMRRATGEALNPEHFRQHLERRYLGMEPSAFRKPQRPAP